MLSHWIPNSETKTTSHSPKAGPGWKPRSLRVEPLESRELLAASALATAAVASSISSTTTAAVVSSTTNNASLSSLVVNCASSATATKLEKLVTDLKTTFSKWSVSSDMIEKLVTDTKKVISDVTNGLWHTVETLYSDLSKKFSWSTLTTLAKNLVTLTGEAKTLVTDVKAVLADVQTIVKATGLTQANVATIVSDIKAFF